MSASLIDREGTENTKRNPPRASLSATNPVLGKKNPPALGRHLDAESMQLLIPDKDVTH